ncbi:probable cyclic nucleotide-gated ion channel 20, chloroplastic [Vicia villosa]|uniref:probable cyclic nucleotide-gated ion channel 20, chloroplastic n=1 Tax=Vicia villosa TaxID=3911 RepID=UPI00273B4201|nr:probable cyclic nucleotide-gated ion channel 20, chloroplastic [Vicia villosa]
MTMINCNSEWRNISATWSGDNSVNDCLSDTSSFAYGIFSRIVPLITETYSVMDKHIFSLFWGFQKTATLAINLSPIYFPWEVRFTWFITGVGLFLHVYLIINMQKFTSDLQQRTLEMQVRRHYVEERMRHRRYLEGLRRRWL